MTWIKKRNLFVQLFFASVLIGSGLSYSHLYLAHILSLPILFIIFSETKLNAQDIQVKGNWHWIFALMIFWYALTIIWSYDSILSIRYLVYILFGCFLLYSVIYFSNAVEKQHQLFKTLLVVLLFETGICFIEVFTSFRYPISQYSEHLNFFNRAFTDVPRTYEELKSMSYYPTGFHWNPNNLAVLFGLAFPFALYSKNNWFKYSGVLIIFFITIMASSRAVYIGLTAMFIVFLFLKGYRYLLLGLLALGCMQIAVSKIGTHHDNAYVKRFTETTDNSGIIYFVWNKLHSEESSKDGTIKKDTSSLFIRTLLIKNGMNELVKTKGLGVGGGASVIVQEKALGEISDIRSMHNFWVEMLVESGVIFTLLFFVWYFLIAFKLYRISIQEKINETLKYHAKALFLAFCGFLITAMSPSSVIYFFPMWLLFGFAISTILIFQKFEDETVAIS